MQCCKLTGFLSKLSLRRGRVLHEDIWARAPGKPVQIVVDLGEKLGKRSIPLDALQLLSSPSQAPSDSKKPVEGRQDSPEAVGLPETGAGEASTEARVNDAAKKDLREVSLPDCLKSTTLERGFFAQSMWECVGVAREEGHEEYCEVDWDSHEEEVKEASTVRESDALVNSEIAVSLEKGREEKEEAKEIQEEGGREDRERKNEEAASIYGVQLSDLDACYAYRGAKVAGGDPVELGKWRQQSVFRVVECYAACLPGRCFGQAGGAAGLGVEKGKGVAGKEGSPAGWKRLVFAFNDDLALLLTPQTSPSCPARAAAAPAGPLDSASSVATEPPLSAPSELGYIERATPILWLRRLEVHTEQAGLVRLAWVNPVTGDGWQDLVVLNGSRLVLDAVRARPVFITLSTSRFG